jgi:hypothetical protein
MLDQCERSVKLAALLLVLLALATTVRAADFKIGTYSITVGGVNYSIKYYEGNKVTVTRGGEVAVEGTYKVTGDEIEVTDERGLLPAVERRRLADTNGSWRIRC